MARGLDFRVTCHGAHAQWGDARGAAVVCAGAGAGAIGRAGGLGSDGTVLRSSKTTAKRANSGLFPPLRKPGWVSGPSASSQVRVLGAGLRGGFAKAGPERWWASGSVVGGQTLGSGRCARALGGAGPGRLQMQGGCKRMQVMPRAWVEKGSGSGGGGLAVSASCTGEGRRIWGC